MWSFYSEIVHIKLRWYIFSRLAIYEEGVLRLLEKLDLPEKAKVRITISGNFSKLLNEVGEIEAKEDIDQVLGNMRTRDYYG